MDLFKNKNSGNNYVAMLAGVLVVGLAYFWNIDLAILREDEADTLNFARNLLNSGVPTAFDGRNVLAFENCSALSADLLSKKLPWVQYYVAALSILLFGDTLGGGRALFSLIGILCFFPLRALLQQISKFPNLIATIVLVSPQLVFFQRNARYYSLLVFLFLLLVWFVFNGGLKPIYRAIALFFISTTLMHSHQLAGCGILLGILIYQYLTFSSTRKSDAACYFFALCAWGIFNGTLSPIDGQFAWSDEIRQIGISLWIETFLRGWVAAIVDLDTSNSLPLIGCLLLAAMAYGNKEVRHRCKVVLQTPLAGCLITCTVVQIMASTITVGYETPSQYSLARYYPNSVGLLIIPLLLMLEQILDIQRFGVRKSIVPFSFFLFVSSNFATVSYWIHLLPSRIYPLSWWLPVYSEIVTPRSDGMPAALAFAGKDNSSHKITLKMQPSYFNEIAIYYAGDKFIVRPDVVDGTGCAKSVRAAMLENEFLHLMGHEAGYDFDHAEVVMAVNGQLDSSYFAYAKYKMPYISYPPHRPDGTRPELSRYRPITSDQLRGGAIYVYKKNQE